MRVGTAFTFTRAAPRYWGSVYPQVCAEMARQRRRAAAIPDPRLRAVALAAIESKRVNIDGAAAFAAFAPAVMRPAVVRAQVAFQAIYDYLDVLTEQPHADPIANSRQLHGALLAALGRPDGAVAGAEGGTPRQGVGEARMSHGTVSRGAAAEVYARHPAGGEARMPDGSVSRGAAADFYARHPASDDGGYLQGTIERCREALGSLPSYAAVRLAAGRLAERILDYQSFNVGDGELPRRALAGWALRSTPAGSGLRWWETAASAGSSLGLFALIAMAAQPGVTAAQALAVESAYFPWIGALHSLLDSLVDLAEDGATGQHPLIEHYGSAAEIASGLRRLAEESRRRAAALPDADRHAAILASMACIYLAEREASRPHARLARREVLSALGGLSAPAMLVMRARRVLAASV